MVRKSTRLLGGSPNLCRCPTLCGALMIKLHTARRGSAKFLDHENSSVPRTGPSETGALVPRYGSVHERHRSRAVAAVPPRRTPLSGIIRLRQGKVASVRRPLLGLVLLTIGGPALAQGAGAQADAPKGGPGGPSASSGQRPSKEQSKSWADEVRSSIGRPRGGDAQGAGASQGGGGKPGSGGEGQPGPKR